MGTERERMGTSTGAQDQVVQGDFTCLVSPSFMPDRAAPCGRDSNAGWNPDLTLGPFPARGERSVIPAQARTTPR